MRKLELMTTFRRQIVANVYDAADEKANFTRFTLNACGYRGINDGETDCCRSSPQVS